tara:strand:+ start:317 stop:541 length:225 start_codon:yes stop_codon:yes gene_type:complete
MSLSAQQTGKDGVGNERTLIGSSVRIRALEVSKIRESTIRITGTKSGATWVIKLIVRPGGEVITSGPIPSPSPV